MSINVNLFFYKNKTVCNKTFKHQRVPCGDKGVDMATTVLDREAEHSVIIQSACSFLRYRSQNSNTLKTLGGGKENVGSKKFEACVQFNMFTNLY